MSDPAREDLNIQELASTIMAPGRIVHEPSRLALLAILRRTGGGDCLFIRRLTNLSKGNLSNHLRPSSR